MPAVVTEASVQNQIAAVVDLLENARDYGYVNVANLLADVDAARALLQTDYSADVDNAIEGARAAFAVFLAQNEAMLEPLFQTYRGIAAIDLASEDIDVIFAAIRDHFETTGQFVTSRGLVFAPFVLTAGALSTANGVLQRLTVDRYGQPKENAWASAKKLVCTADRTTGQDEGAETFTFDGGTAAVDDIRRTGSGGTGEVTGLTGADSQSFIGNPSFGDFTEAAGGLPAIDDLTDWTFTAGTVADVGIDQTNFYRTFSGEGDPSSLILNGNVTIAQDLAARRAQFDPDTPIYRQVAINRLGTGADGTLSLTHGAATTSVVLGSLPASGWSVLFIPLAADAYYENFNQPGSLVPAVAPGHLFEISLTGGATFGAVIDDCIIGPYTEIENHWYALVGGDSPFLLDDEFNGTDTEPTSPYQGKLQRWFWRTFDQYLHTSGAGVLWPDP